MQSYNPFRDLHLKKSIKKLKIVGLKSIHMGQNTPCTDMCFTDKNHLVDKPKYPVKPSHLGGFRDSFHRTRRNNLRGQSRQGAVCPQCCGGAVGSYCAMGKQSEGELNIFLVRLNG